MSDEDASGATGGLAELLAKNFSSLILLSVWQTRALMAISSAIERDPAVSAETRLAAKEAYSMVEKMIEEIDKLSNGTVKLGAGSDGE